MHEPSLVRRVAERLWQSEVSQPNPQYQADIRIAYITVLFAARGVPRAHVHASQIVLGLHPDKVWPRIVERRRAMLGKDYPLFCDEAGNYKLDPVMESWINPTSPRKPVQSVRLYPKPPEQDAA